MLVVFLRLSKIVGTLFTEAESDLQDPRIALADPARLEHGLCRR